MQIIRRYLAGIIVVVCLLSSLFSMQSRQVAVYLPMQVNTEMEKRACWISYIDMESELSDKSEAAFRAKVHAMYDTVKRYGLNTVIVHARAMGDAFYPSDYFPYSEYMSKTRTYPGYDPYEIMVAVAHEEGLRFEAWINPYRLSLGEETTASFEHTPFYAKYQSMILEYQGQNGTCLVLNPQSAEAQQLVVNQVAEILERYPVDGIHFDDYFFVDGMQDTLPQEEKMQAVNALVQKVYQTVKQKRPDCEFGISPAGNPDYARSQGADINTWLSQEGYVDYVMPQIYWTDRYVTDGKEVSMFSNRCEVWQTLHTNPEIKLYAGLALYRVGETSDTDLDWALREDNLATQCAHIYGMGYDGFALIPALTGLVQMALLGLFLYLTMLPIIVLTSRHKGSFLVGVIVAFVYGFIGMFANGTLQSIYPVSAALGLINYRAGAEGVMWNKGLCFISILIMCAIGIALMFVKQKPEKREAKKTQHTAPKKGW